MTKETGPDGVLTDEEIHNTDTQPFCTGERERDRIHHLVNGRIVAYKQHQATRKATLEEVREKVKGTENPYHSITQLEAWLIWDSSIQAVLKVLGENK